MANIFGIHRPRFTAVMARFGASLALVMALGGALVAGDSNVVAPDDWVAVPPQSLRIQQGSALDFSGLVPMRVAGSDGALSLGADGQLHLGDTAAPRFNCAMLANGPDLSWALPAHEEADALAQQLRRHGYNLVRFHFMDGRLAVGTPRGQDVNPESLDRYYYLLAALKKNGIYWMLDILTSANGPQAKSYDNSHSVEDLKARVNYDPAARAEWLKMLNEVYTQPNPYTGVTPLADPALAFVIGVNESSLGFWMPYAKDGPYSVALAQRFDEWARARFRTPVSLQSAASDLTVDERSGHKPIAPPADWNTTSGPRAALFRAFIASLEIDTYKWMSDQMAERGYRGPVLGYPEWYQGSSNRTRAALPITDLHAYIGDINSYSVGSNFDMPAMISDRGLSALLLAASGRWRDRPLIFSEYGSPFPNPFRRDNAVTYPALASFQDYSTICRMASMSIEPTIPASKADLKPIFPYRVGLDPVQRVDETLSALLFFRRDVSSAIGPGIAIPFGDNDTARPGSAFIPSTISRAALLVKFGLMPLEKIGTLPKKTQIVPPGKAAGDSWSKAMGKLIAMTGGGKQQTSDIVSALFAQGQLPRGNRTSVSDGIYESQTGEMLLDQQRGQIAIRTPRTEALNTNTPASGVSLNTLSVRSTNVGALVAASSLDGKPLRDSDRVLLMLVGDARNSQMTLANAGSRSRLVGWGNLPIMLQRVIAKITLNRDRAFTGQFTTLALNGEPIASRPVSSRAGKLELTLDTASVPTSPTTFFLVERR